MQLMKPTAIPNGPHGTRWILGITGGSFEGPRLRGVVEVPGADWATGRPDGSIKHDGRALMRTDDGAAILLLYHGVGLTREGRATLRASVQFETGSPAYGWLNNVQAVAVGSGQAGSMVIEVYAIE
jgi:hypothetical protein